jgi:predicted metalloprotease with PDZ domain
MRVGVCVAASVVAVCAALAVFPFATRGASSRAMEYELKFDAPNTHLMDVTIKASDLDGKGADFALPDWAPGSYYIENYWMNVQNFDAKSESGQELTWRKTDEQTWHVDLGGAKGATISYKMYANTLANNCAQYDEHHAFIGGPSLWMYLVNGKDRAIRLSIATPGNWKVATGMTPDGANKFSAVSFDWFADEPLEISDFKEQTFDFGGTKYHVIVHDIEGQKDFSGFTADTQKIVQNLVPIFSSVAGNGNVRAPFTDYYFLFHVWPKAGGGLEHLNSTQIDFSKDWDDKSSAGDFGDQYQLKLFVTAHEFFHAWNVKRLRPRPLGPFDYSREVHTPSLWISEGLTSYYGALAVERAGLVTPQEYLDGIGKLITKFESLPGRKERSIEDTSFDTWFVRDSRLDTNLTNTNYSYYDGGQILGHLLDFAIRHNTKNQKTLDDWMRLMYSRYALPKPGFEPEDAVKALSETGGMDFTDFSKKYISGKQDLPYETYFAYAGISVEKKLDTGKPWLGISTAKNDDGRAKITSVVPGSPAEAGGLEKDDVILGMNNRAVTSDDFDTIFGAVANGATVKFVVQRINELKEVQVKVGTTPFYTYTLKPMDRPDEMQLKIYKSWMGIQ